MEQRQQLETAYQQTCGAIASLYEFAPQEEGEDAEIQGVSKQSSVAKRVIGILLSTGKEKRDGSGCRPAFMRSMYRVTTVRLIG